MPTQTKLTKYAILLRGINVGGKNKVSMLELKRHLENAGYQSVQTYINSGNVILLSNLDASTIATQIENILVENFSVGGEIIRVLVVDKSQLDKIIKNKPAGFGDSPDVYYSDVIFLMGIDTDEALKVFKPRDGVDKIWQGDGVIYSQRLSAMRTKSRLNRIMSSPVYKSMTIRNWNTTVKLLEMMNHDEN